MTYHENERGIRAYATAASAALDFEFSIRLAHPVESQNGDG